MSSLIPNIILVAALITCVAVAFIQDNKGGRDG